MVIPGVVKVPFCRHLVIYRPESNAAMQGMDCKRHAPSTHFFTHIHAAL